MKRWLALLLVAIMVFSLTACSLGKGDDTKDPGGDTDDPGGDTQDPGGDTKDPGKDVLQGEFIVLSDQEGVYSFLKELSFVYKADNKDKEDESYTYSHKYLDSEVVDYELDGESHSDNAKHFQVTIDEDAEKKVYEVWVNEAETIVKAGSEEDGYGTGDMAGLHSFGFIFHLIPFCVYNQAYAEVFTKDGGFSTSGWEVKEHSKGSKDFGAGNVRVETYQFAWSWTKDAIVWEVAEVNGRYLFTQWKIVEDEGNVLELIVNRVIPF